MGNKHGTKVNKNKQMANISTPSMFLFTSYVNKNGAPKARLEPVCKTLLFNKDPAEIDTENIDLANPPCLVTDNKGMLYNFNPDQITNFDLRTPFRAGKLDDVIEIPVILPPKNIVSLQALTKNDWLKKLSKAIQNLKFPDGLPKLKLQKISKHQLASPNNENYEYKIWYNSLGKDSEIYGYIIPKIRAIIMFFTLPIFDGDEKVQIRHADTNTSITDENGENAIKIYSLKILNKKYPNNINGLNVDTATHMAMISTLDTDYEFPNGIYEVTVTGVNKDFATEDAKKTSETETEKEKEKESKLEKCWNADIENKNSYTLSVPMRFDIKNHAGEFCIVNADPITLEESLIIQHPQYYNHYLQQALIESTPEIYSKTAESDKSAPKNLETPTGYQYFIKQWGNAKDIADFANDTIGIDSKSKGVLTAAKIIYKYTDDLYNADTKQFITMAFDTFATADAWKKLYEALEADEIEDLVKSIKTVKSSYKAIGTDFKSSTISSLKKAKADFFTKGGWLGTPDKADEYMKTLGGKLGIPQGAAAFLGRSLDAIGIITSIADIGAKGYATYDANKKLEASIDDLTEITKSYLDLFGSKQIYKKIDLDVKYRFDKDVIDTDFIEDLTRIKTILDEFTSMDIHLEGHTDFYGTDEYNLDLSRRRANSVKNWLISNGISESRITTQGYGESMPLDSETTDAARAKNRRTVAVLYVPRESGCAPCREGINNLEKFRTMAVQKRIAYAKSYLDIADAIFDCALAIAAVIPVTAPAALAISLAKAGIQTAKDADMFFTGGALTRSVDELLDTDIIFTELTMNDMANMIELRNLPFADTKELCADQQQVAQFRARSAVITGLLRLIVRANLSAVDDKTSVESKIVQYKIKEYIETFILKDQWQLPLKTQALIGLDEYWLYATSKYNKDCGKEVEEISDENLNDLLVFRNRKMDDPSEITDEKAATRFVLKQMYFGSIDKDLPGHLKTDFHKMFPIHAIATTNIVKLANEMNPDFGNLKDEASELYEHTALYYKPIEEGDDWLSFAAESSKHHTRQNPAVIQRRRGGNTKLNTNFSISPLCAIKILIVFKDAPKGENPLAYVNRIAPVSVKLDRYDWFEAGGPVYKSIARKLTKHDLEDLPDLSDSQKSKLEGRYGCVIHPFFKIGNSTFNGTKPLASWYDTMFVSSAKDLEEGGELTDMRYGFTCIVGNQKKTQKDVELSSLPYWTNGNSPAPKGFSHLYTVSFNSEDFPDQKKLLDLSFIKSNSEVVNYPELFAGDLTASVNVKFCADGKDTPFINGMASSKEINQCKAAGLEVSNQYRSITKEYHLAWDNFDWTQPIEFMFTLACTEIKTNTYEENKQSWKKIPGSVELYETNGVWPIDSESKGPRLKLDFIYLGKITWSNWGSNFSFLPESGIASDDLVNFQQRLNTIEDFQNLTQVILKSPFGTDKPKSGEYHIFAAHVNGKQLKYTAPTGIYRETIRPFGNDKINKDGTPDDEYYRYGFRNISTAGLSFGELRRINPSTSGTIGDQFYLKSPKSFFTGAPWTLEELNPAELIYVGETELKKIKKASSLSYEDSIKWLEEKSNVQHCKPLSAIKDIE